MPSLLVAIDLDGTLLEPDGSIDERDRIAIARARSAGVAISIATGRLATGALPTARRLDLDEALICVDGGLLACARTGRPLEQRAIAPARAERLLEAILDAGAAPFAFVADAIHGDAAFGEPHAQLRAWSPTITMHPSLRAARAWRERPVVLALGVGEQDAVERVAAAIGAPELDVATFPLADHGWAVRAQPIGCSKGAALASLAARLGVARAQVAAIGDWYNDVSMLAWAGRSFAMPGAPDEVRAFATDALAPGERVADAIDRLLDRAAARFRAS